MTTTMSSYHLLAWGGFSLLSILTGTTFLSVELVTAMDGWAYTLVWYTLIPLYLIPYTLVWL